jgi:TonB family protein
MRSALSFIVSYLINSVWEVALVAAAGWLVSRFLKRLGPQAEHITWVSTLALAIITPVLPFLHWLSAFLYVPGKPSEYSLITDVSAQNVGMNSGSTYALPIFLIVLLVSLYVSSLLYFGLRLAWSLGRTAILLRESPPVWLTTDQAQVWSHCRQSFSLGKARILSSSRISGPVTLGLREPVLLMPVEFTTGCTSQDFLAALAHECAHIKRRDFQKNLFYEFASLIVAFHPLTWIIKGQIAKTREMICDGMATEKLIDLRSYIKSLLRLASMICMAPRVTTRHAIGIFDANVLEKRIMMMNVKKQHLGSALKVGLIIPASAFLFSVAFGGAAMAVVVSPQAASESVDPAMPDGPIYRIGKGVSAPVLIESQDPVYPESARQGKDKFEGVCILRLVVDASGKPRDVHVIRALGPDFDANAIKAVQQYRFKPARRSGEPVAVSVNIEVNFKKY